MDQPRDCETVTRKVFSVLAAYRVRPSILIKGRKRSSDCEQIGGPMAILAFQKALLIDSSSYIARITNCCKCFLRQPWCLFGRQL
ncbi:hypothetical protein QUC31_014496 [Theobroma cacao]